MYREHEFKLQANVPLFSDAGMTPGGGSWLTPTNAFMKLWEHAGEHLTEKGCSLARFAGMRSQYTMSLRNTRFRNYPITKCVISRSQNDIHFERDKKMKDFQWKRLDKANREMAIRLEKLRKVRASGDKHGIKMAEMAYLQALQCVYAAAVDAVSGKAL